MTTYGDLSRLFDYRGDLFEAMARPSLDSPDHPEFQQACLWLTAALGRCHFYGTDLGKYDGVLPTNIAIPAARELSTHIQKLNTRMKKFAEEWHTDKTEIEEFEDDDAVCGFLFMRMDFWASFIAIDEAYQDSLEREPNADGTFRKALSQVVEDTKMLDAEMQKHLNILCNAAGSELLNNWRGMLAGEYGEALPWWLDGCLERVFAEQQVV
jgi:hypothetical protein